MLFLQRLNKKNKEEGDVEAGGKVLDLLELQNLKKNRGREEEGGEGGGGEGGIVLISYLHEPDSKL